MRVEKVIHYNAYTTMRLLESDGNGGFRLTRDYVNNIPPFAILSHTWGPDTDEVTFPDLVEKRACRNQDTRRSVSVESKLNAMAYSTFGLTPVVLTNRTIPSSQRLSIPCFVGTVTPLNVMSTCQMSLYPPRRVPVHLTSNYGNQTFEGAGGLHGDGLFKNLLLR